MALISAGLAGALTTLNAGRRVTQAHSSANAYLAIQTEIRQLRTIDLAHLSFDDARQRLGELTARIEEVNKQPTCPRALPTPSPDATSRREGRRTTLTGTVEYEPRIRVPIASRSTVRRGSGWFLCRLTFVSMGAPRHPARAEVVGSLLRPQSLRQAVDNFYAEGHSAIQAEEREKDPTGLREIEDAAILDAVQRQIDLGLDVVTDGEFRRWMFMNSFYDAVSRHPNGQDGELPERPRRGR